eukprot:4575180-Amphidinium_carterae.1
MKAKPETSRAKPQGIQTAIKNNFNYLRSHWGCHGVSAVVLVVGVGLSKAGEVIIVWCSMAALPSRLFIQSTARIKATLPLEGCWHVVIRPSYETPKPWNK